MVDATYPPVRCPMCGGRTFVRPCVLCRAREARRRLAPAVAEGAGPEPGDPTPGEIERAKPPRRRDAMTPRYTPGIREVSARALGLDDDW